MPQSKVRLNRLTKKTEKQNIIIKRAKNLREGDSCVKVEELLGSPNYVSHSLLFTEETWTYGTYLDPYFFKKFPYIIPFKMRALFSHNDDIVIGFDMSGDVVSIEIPNK